MSTEHGSKIKFKTKIRCLMHYSKSYEVSNTKEVRPWEMGSASLNVRMSWRYQYFAVLGKLTYVDSGTCSSSPKEYTPDSPTEVCCAFRGWPLPRIIWRKTKPDSKRIVNGSDGFSLSAKLEGNDTLRSLLRISKSKEKHEGEYECIAESSMPGWPSPEPVIFELSLQCEWGPEGAGHSL